MAATVGDVINTIETLAPLSLAEAWDNPGLQIGHRDWPVQTIRIALDPSLDVISHACKERIDLLITHHPLILKPITSIDYNTPVGSVIYMAAVNKLAIFSAHTNLDSATDGLNDMLAEKIGLQNIKGLQRRRLDPGMKKADFEKVMEHFTTTFPDKNVDYHRLSPFRPSDERQGIGRVGELDEAVSLQDFAGKLKESLNLSSVKMVGKPSLKVKKVALCTGSGASLIKDFISSGAHVYLSGDLKYHDARTIEEHGKAALDIGHFNSEHLAIKIWGERLKRLLFEAGVDVNVAVYQFEKDPFAVV